MATPAAGAFLVASEALSDPNFMRTVVFLLEHGEAGSMGLIINRPLGSPLSAIWEDAPAGIAGAALASEGGPVERGHGLLLHGQPDLPGAQVLGHGLALGGALAALATRFSGGPDAAGPRLFLGHSGWGPGQLAAELAQGAWLLRSGRPGHVLVAPPEDLWERLLAGGGVLPEPSVN